MPTSLYLTAHQPAKWARLLDLASSHTGLAQAYLAVANSLFKVKFFLANLGMQKSIFPNYFYFTIDKFLGKFCQFNFHILNFLTFDFCFLQQQACFTQLILAELNRQFTLLVKGACTIQTIHVHISVGGVRCPYSILVVPGSNPTQSR